MPDRGRRLLSAREAPPHSGAWRTRKRIVNFGVAGLVALIVHFVVPTWLHGATRFVASYDAGALALLAMSWRGLTADPQRTRLRAADEDPGRNVVGLIIFGAVAVGLVAAIAIVGHGPQVRTDVERWEAYGLGLVAIGVGWFLVHTVYTFRYAHLYYYDDDGDGCGGIKFPGTDEPSDWDFAYFAFCIGTSFAVSDPQVTETRVRREIIGHSIIAFAYNSVIIGMVINLFAGIFAAPAPGK
ncbi:MAG: DUF1345 domain-containing protein [Candidatus Eremiobacteraeota bacterium]|nr:DUF1345 domain-containing protein [Candidatus Eremiobacteraeota bacterium]